jgi:photosystem II stability/assembly factor-like uncharacterized protein
MRFLLLSYLRENILGCLSGRALAVAALLLIVSVGQAQTLPAPVPGLPFWEWQAPRPTGLGLTDFYAFNDSSIVAVGGHGTAVKTGNGGRTWQVLPTGVDRALTSVSFANDLVGWIGTETAPTTARHRVTGVGRLLRTTDGGQSWVAQSIGEPTLSVRSPQVVAVSPTEAYVTYYLTGYLPAPNNNSTIDPAPRMRRTTNGGQTWTLVTLPIGGSFDTNGTISIPPLFTSATTGFIIAGFGTYQLLRTTDSGQTWQNVAPGTPSTFRPTQLTFLTAQRGWLTGIDAGGSAVLYQTVDGGQTWTFLTTLSFLSNAYSGPISFATPLRGLLTAGPENYVTSDGGLTWTQTSTGPAIFSSGLFQQTRLLPGGGGGWSVGSVGSLYRTRDYGQSWQSRSSLPPAYRTNALGMPDPTHGWAIPFFADIQNYTTLLRTRHRGEGWQPLSLEGALPGLNWQQNAILLGGAFPDADTVWVVGAEYDAAQQPIGLVLRTTTGGQSWQRQSLGGVYLLGGINEIGSWGTSRAVAVSQLGKALFVTRTGGASWTNVPNPAPRRRPQRVTWADSATVYVTTDSAVFFKSTTAGRTWQVLPMPASSTYFSPLYNFAFTSAQVGYLADGLGIWKTTNGGTSWQFTDVSAQASFDLNGNQNPLLAGVSFRTKQAGWAFGQTDFFQTQNGGQTWTKVAYVYGGGRGTLTTGPGVVIDQYNAVASGSGVVRYSEKFIQADTSRNQTRSYCAGGSLTLGFTTEGTLSQLPADYRVQVSNRMGRFRNGETTTLVPTAASSARLLAVTLPATLPAGTRYRLRVIAADSSVLGGDNERDLTVNALATASISPAPAMQSICQGSSLVLTASPNLAQYAWSTGATTRSITVSTAGTYTVRGAAAAGCLGPASAPVTVAVVPLPTLPLVVQLPTGQLSVSAPVTGATYQWLLAGSPLTGATGVTYPATGTPAPGTYTVVATVNGCASAASAPLAVVLATRPQQLAGFTLYPNPARTTLWLERPVGAAAATVQLLDATGRVAWQGTAGAGISAFPVQQLPAGLYLVRVQTPTGPPAVLRVVVEH